MTDCDHKQLFIIDWTVDKNKKTPSISSLPVLVTQLVNQLKDNWFVSFQSNRNNDWQS